MNISITHTHIFQNLNINNAEFDQSSGNSFSGHEPKINSFIQSESASSESYGRSGHFDLKLMPLAWLGRFQLRLTLYD